MCRYMGTTKVQGYSNDFDKQTYVKCIYLSEIHFNAYVYNFTLKMDLLVYHISRIWLYILRTMILIIK